MSIHDIFKESGPYIADLIDPSLHATSPEWFYRSSLGSFVAFGRVKKSNCGVKITVEESNDDFTALVIAVEAKYDVGFSAPILTKTLTAEVLLDYIDAGLRIVAAEMEEYDLLD